MSLPTTARPLPWDHRQNRSYPPVEKRAAEIYAILAANDLDPDPKPAWFPGGNSDKQEYARDRARQELRDAGHTPELVSVTTTDRRKALILSYHHLVLAHHQESERIGISDARGHHVLGMLMKMHDEAFDDGKFYRWLGFVQGYLWSFEIRTIDEMRDDNRGL